MLACGIGAFASGHATIGLRGLRPHVDGPIDVTVVGRRVRRAGVRVHETASMHRGEVELLGGIRVSTTARALLEVASELSQEELAEAVERAQVKRLVTKHQLEAVLAPNRAL